MIINENLMIIIVFLLYFSEYILNVELMENYIYN